MKIGSSPSRGWESHDRSETNERSILDSRAVQVSGLQTYPHEHSAQSGSPLRSATIALISTPPSTQEGEERDEPWEREREEEEMQREKSNCLAWVFSLLQLFISSGIFHKNLETHINSPLVQTSKNSYVCDPLGPIACLVFQPIKP